MVSMFDCGPRSPPNIDFMSNVGRVSARSGLYRSDVDRFAASLRRGPKSAGVRNDSARVAALPAATRAEIGSPMTVASDLPKSPSRINSLFIAVTQLRLVTSEASR